MAEQPKGTSIRSRTRSSGPATFVPSNNGDVLHPHDDVNAVMTNGSTNPRRASRFSRDPNGGHGGAGPSRQPNPPRSYHPYTSHQDAQSNTYPSTSSYPFTFQQRSSQYQAPTWSTVEESAWAQPPIPNTINIPHTYSTQPRFPYSQGQPSNMGVSSLPPSSGIHTRFAELSSQAGPSSYIPPHLRGKFGSSSQGQKYSTSSHPARTTEMDDTDTSFNSNADTSFETPKSKARSRAKFVVKLPTPEYIALSDPTTLPAQPQGEAKPKLLVLDMNGALIYRNRASNGKIAYPRPYLASFLEYLFLPDPITAAEPRPWEVFVWSSAQPHNVRGMVESTFGDVFVRGIWDTEGLQERLKREERGEGRLVGVWARDKLGLDENAYRHKVQTVKDLRVLSSHLISTLPTSKNTTLNDLKFDESNMVLLDDSPLKGVHQPWNQILLPEFDKEGNQASRTAALKAEQDGEAIPEGMDDALLCVIGMLEEMRSVDNVPAWIRVGGLTPTLDPLGNPQTIRKTSYPRPKIDNLPTHESFVHWFSIPAVRAYWLGKGKAALRRKGIELRHGLDPTENSTSSPAQPRVRTSEAGHSRQMKDINGAMSMSSIDDPTDPDRRKFKSLPRKSRGYSPSRPNDIDAPSPTPRSASPDKSSWRSTSAPTRIRYDDDGHPIPPGLNGASQTKTKSQPNRLIPVDSAKWRTFKTHDVASFLLDISARGTTPLTDSQRENLQKAASIIGILGPNSDAEDGDGDDEMEGIEDLHVNDTIIMPGGKERKKSNQITINMGEEDDMPIRLDDGDMLRNLKRHLHPREAARLTKGRRKVVVSAESAPEIPIPFPRYSNEQISTISQTSDTEDGQNGWLYQKRLRKAERRLVKRQAEREAKVVEFPMIFAQQLMVDWQDLYNSLTRAIRAGDPWTDDDLVEKIRRDHCKLDDIVVELRALDVNDKATDRFLDARSRGRLPGGKYIRHADRGRKVPSRPSNRLPSAIPTSELMIIDTIAKINLSPTPSMSVDEDEDDEMEEVVIGPEKILAPTAEVVKPSSSFGLLARKVVNRLLSKTKKKKNTKKEPEKTTLVEQEAPVGQAPSSFSIACSLWEGRPDTPRLEEALRISKLKIAMIQVNKIEVRGDLPRKAIAALCNEAQRQLARSLKCEKEFSEAVNHKQADIFRAIITRKAPVTPGAILAETNGMEVEETGGIQEPWVYQALTAGAQPTMLKELETWRETAFLDILVPVVDLAHLIVLILRQMYQDFYNHKPSSHPLHFANTSLSLTYPDLFTIIREKCVGKTPPRQMDIFEIAIREARRWLYLRDEAQGLNGLESQGSGKPGWELEDILSPANWAKVSVTRTGGPRLSTIASGSGPEITQEEVSTNSDPVFNALRGDNSERLNTLVLAAHAASMAIPVVNTSSGSKRPLLSVGSLLSDIANTEEVGDMINERGITSKKRRGPPRYGEAGREREAAVGWEWNEKEMGYWPVEHIEGELKIFD